MPRYTKKPQCEQFTYVPNLDKFSETELFEFASRYEHPSPDDARFMLGNDPGFKKNAKTLGMYAKCLGIAKRERRLAESKQRNPENAYPRPDIIYRQWDVDQIVAAHFEDSDNHMAQAERLFAQLPEELQWRSVRYPPHVVDGYSVERGYNTIMVKDASGKIVYHTCPERDTEAFHETIKALMSALYPTNPPAT